MLSDKHRANFATLGEALLADDYELHMGDYFSDYGVRGLYKHNDLGASVLRKMFHHFNTSCCAQGLAAVTSGISQRKGETPESHVVRVFGIDSGVVSLEDSGSWDFAFSCGWPNDKAEASARCMYLSKHGKPPSSFDYSDRYAEAK